MNWPAPTQLPPPEVDDTPPSPAIEPESERRRLSAVPAATWLALLGAALVIAAAVAVVVSNWDTIGQTFRVAGLTLATAGLLLAADRLRHLVPTTAGVVAHVGTALTASVGIATMSLAGFTWPACITVGGAALVVATTVQATRWRRVTMHLAQLVGLALVATGLAAMLSTTAGLIAVLLAVCLLVAGAQRRSVALSILAVCSPALTALADAGIGDGTLERAGLVGAPLGWSGPLVGLVAAMIIGAIGMRRRNNTLVMLAWASPIVGLVTGMAATGAPAAAWWTVPALGLLAAELSVRSLPADRTSGAIDQLLDGVGGLVAFGLWCAPLLVSVGAWATGHDGTWAVPTIFAAVAVAASTLRWNAVDSRIVDLGLTSIAAGAIAVGVSFGLADLLVAAIAVGATVGATLLSRRLSPIALYGAAAWALLAIAAAADPGTSITTAATALLLATLAAVAIIARSRLAAAGGVLGWIEMSLVTAATAATATVLTDLPGATVWLTVTAAVMLAVVLVEQRYAIWGLAIIGVTGAIALDAASAAPSLDPSITIGWLAAAVALAVLWLVRRRLLFAHGAAAASVIAVATSAAWFGIDTLDVAVMAMLGTVALTGLAWTVGRTPLDSAAVAAGLVTLVSTSFDIDPAWSSMAWIVVGLQVVVGGLAWRMPVVTGLGGLVTIAGLIDGWHTTGLHDWFLTVIAPADITTADLWVAALTVAALVAGGVLRRTLSVNSWVADGPALLIAGLHLIAVELERAPVWALPLLAVVGVTATVVGGWHRRAAPLVGGTALTVAALFLATGSDLTAVPTWVWLATGGAVLLAAAVTIERGGVPGRADLRELVRRWD